MYIYIYIDYVSISLSLYIYIYIYIYIYTQSRHITRPETARCSPEARRVERHRAACRPPESSNTPWP